jgi:rhomboid family GlyGly-CTERM serine protease
MSTRQQAPRTHAGPAVAAAVTAGLLMVAAVLPPSWQQAGALRRSDVLAGEGWRLWSGHLVHFGLPHAWFDALALAALVFGALQTLSPARLLGAGLVVAPLLSLSVLGLEPGLQEYRGASGLVVALLAWTVADLWRRRAVPRRWLALGAIGLVGKVAWDAGPGRHVASGVLPAGVAVAWSAHLAGAVLGALWGGCVRTAQDPRIR